jgi:hypothetical protein
MPVGMLIFGPLADRFTVEAVLVASGLATFLVVALAVALPSGRQAMHTNHQQSTQSESLDSDNPGNPGNPDTDDSAGTDAVDVAKAAAH